MFSALLCTVVLLIAPTQMIQAQWYKSKIKRQKEIKDSVYIEQVEQKLSPEKVLHAEPLYIDLIRDLGARKGEREWNFGMGITDNTRYDSYEALVEYEWAPINRLGLEIELPFSFYTPLNGTSREETPGNRLESIKTAMQWSFLVDTKRSLTMALGYINELELPTFRAYGKGALVTGNIYNPFLVAAKRLGTNFHSLLYTGPSIHHQFANGQTQTSYQAHTSFHYMIPGTRNFVGIEFNKEWYRTDFDLVIRPQLRVAISEDLLIGIVAGIPVNRENQRFSSFMRLIWEPPHKKGKRLNPGKTFPEGSFPH